MTPSRHSDALRAAQLYYLQDLTMDAIARELRTSRSTVSRLLSSARESGLVQIQIRSPLDTGPELASMIRAEYKVDVHVVPVVDTLNEAETLDRVAMQAARTIGPLVDSNAIIGVAWGSTLSAVSRHLTRKITHDSVIVQLNGAGNMQTTGITYASDIMRRFGSAYGARVEQFPVPAFFDHAATKKAMWNERSVQRILELQARMSIAIFGVGSVDADYPSHVYAGGYLDEDDLNVLANSDVVGDVATVFFRADGSSDGITLNERSTGPDLAQLRQVRRRICVVSGASKFNGLRGALAAGLATDLILDEASARRLVSFDGLGAEPACRGERSGARGVGKVEVMKPSPRLSLNNGVLIDQLGFGLYKVPPGDAAGLVSMALEAGYRHFDTAAMYGNETGVGRGIGSLSGFSSHDDARGGSGESSPALSREDLFVTTKLWNDDQGYDATLRAFDTSMANLGLEYVDLYLIHWPCPQRGLYPESYRAMETLYREGRARAIGVSNFQPAHLDRLLQTAEVVPAVNQIELHPWLQQEELRTLHRELGSPPRRGARWAAARSCRIRWCWTSPPRTAGPRRRSSSAGMSSSAMSPSPRRAPTTGSARTWTSSASASTTPPWQALAGLERGFRTGSHPDSVN